MEKYNVDQNRIYIFNKGLDYQAYNVFGAHIIKYDGKTGMRFLVYAPNARNVSVVGNFNDWDKNKNPMEKFGDTGCFITFIEGLKENELYKYLIETSDGSEIYKADPFGFYAEVRPNTASITYDIEGFKWTDDKYLKKRSEINHFDIPKNIYECHLGSFIQHKSNIERKSQDDVPKEDFYTYRELADKLIPYVKDMGYTHIELMPLMEYPYDGSWGYQATGYFGITSRYGAPKDFMYFVDKAHKNNIGIIMDWVPGHYCKDAHGLYMFDGGRVYDGKDHKHWGTTTFNYEKDEVRSFLNSSAVFYIDKYHIDGIRFDGVSSMLYLNYGVENESEKVFNKYGDEGNLAAIDFIQNLNAIVGEKYPGVMTIAEESTAWPNVTKPKEVDNGLGFHYKWDMGWMHDTLNYLKSDFPYREKNHDMFSFSMMYANAENYVLALSHDEVVHGKCSIVNKMPGSYDEKIQQIKVLYLYQMSRPGAILNFMGNEIPEFIEWRYYEGLEWFLLDVDKHKKFNDFIKDLNHLYLKEKSFYELDMKTWEGFDWIDANNRLQNIFIYERIGKDKNDRNIVILNFSKNEFEEFRIGANVEGKYKEILNTNLSKYGGFDTAINDNILKTENKEMHGRKQSLVVKIPALSGVVLKYMG